MVLSSAPADPGGPLRALVSWRVRRVRKLQVLAGRRLLVPRVRATTAPADYVALILLLMIILTGVAPTSFVNRLRRLCQNPRKI